MTELIQHLSLGFSVALTLAEPDVLLYRLLSRHADWRVARHRPGCDDRDALPITFNLPPTPALIMLAGIYYGASYGGSTTAILVNLPGESSSVVTCIDGYQMGRQGRAGPALAIAAMGSFFAGCVGTILIALFGPPLAELAFEFGAAEYFSMMVLGLVSAVVLAHGSLIKAVGMILVGLLLGIVGTDVNSGIARYSFGISELSDGIGFVSVAMGMFGFGEIIAISSRARSARSTRRRSAA